MQPPVPRRTDDAAGQGTIDLEALLGDRDAQFVYEGLYRLREVKIEALRAVQAAHLPASGHRFEPWDFGIPQIDRLLARIGAEPAEDPSPCERG